MTPSNGCVRTFGTKDFRVLVVQNDMLKLLVLVVITTANNQGSGHRN